MRRNLRIQRIQGHEDRRTRSRKRDSESAIFGARRHDDEVILRARDFACSCPRPSVSVRGGGRAFRRERSYAMVALVVDDSMLIRYTVCRFLRSGLCGRVCHQRRGGAGNLEPRAPGPDRHRYANAEDVRDRTDHRAKEQVADRGRSNHHCRQQASGFDRRKSAPTSPSSKISISKLSSARRWRRTGRAGKPRGEEAELELVSMSR